MAARRNSKNAHVRTAQANKAIEKAQNTRQLELDAIRRDIVRKQRNAAAKIRRIEKATGAILSNSPADPRVNARKIARYTTKQLMAHAAKLDQFTNRGTQFVAGVGGVPLSKRKYSEYKALERRNNELGAARMDERGELIIPGSGQTVRQRAEEILNNAVRAQGAAINKPYSKIEREAFNINGNDALDKLIKDMKKKASREYIPEKVKQGRRDMHDMLKVIGNHDLQSMVDQLSDYQFDVFWHETMGAMDVSLMYEIMKKHATGLRERQDQSQLEDSADDIKQLLIWARDEIPADDTKGNKTKR